MRPIWSWYPASSPRSSLASPDSLRTVFLRPCNGSSSRRSRPFSRFSRRVSRFSRRVSRFSRRVSRFSRRVSRFSRTDFPAQRLDRVLLLPRPFQRLAQPGARAGRRSLCRSFRSAKRRDLPAQRHELVLLLLRALQRLAQPGVLPRQRPGRVLPRCRRRRSLERPRAASGRGTVAFFRACDACKASRNRKTSMRSDMIVLRLLDSTPACKRSFSSRATSAW